MTKLLYIKASPRPDSKSAAIADAYLTALQSRDAGISVDRLDLWAEHLPEFDGTKAAAKMSVVTGQTQDNSQKAAWDEISAIAARFISADHYLFAVPMWNGGIPYRLKHYIDIVHQPGITFGLDRSKGYFGRLAGKKATLALTSGAYSPSAPSPAFGVDHHSTYLASWLKQAGVVDVEEILFQPTVITADPEGDLAKAIAVAKTVAETSPV